MRAPGNNKTSPRSNERGQGTWQRGPAESGKYLVDWNFRCSSRNAGGKRSLGLSKQLGAVSHRSRGMGRRQRVRSRGHRGAAESETTRLLRQDGWPSEVFACGCFGRSTGQKARRGLQSRGCVRGSGSCCRSWQTALTAFGGCGNMRVGSLSERSLKKIVSNKAFELWNCGDSSPQGRSAAGSNVGGSVERRRSWS